MIDIQTYRIRIGISPGIMSKILGRKATRHRPSENETCDKRRPMRKFWKIIRPSYLLIAFVIIINVNNRSMSYQTTLGSNYDHVLYKHQTMPSKGKYQLNSSDVLFHEYAFMKASSNHCQLYVGAVEFITILLQIAGIEPNPGPKIKDQDSSATKSATGIKSKIPVSVHRKTFRLHTKQTEYVNKSPAKVTHDYSSNSACQSISGSRKESEMNFVSSFPSPNYKATEDTADTLSNVSELPLDSTSQSIATFYSSSNDESSLDKGVECMESRFIFKESCSLELDLQRKNLTSQNMDKLLQLLVDFEPPREMKTLDLSMSKYCGKPWGQNTDGLEYLQRLLRHPRLQTISKINLQNCGLQTVPESLDTLKQCLRTLNINYNRLSKMENPVASCQRLEILSVSFNQISGK